SSFFFFFSSRRRHTRSKRDWSSDVCSSDLPAETWCRSSGRLEDVNPNHSSPIPTMGEVLRIATGHEPDQRGHWGAFGGRYVPEALMAVVDEVTDAYDKARLDEEYLARLDRLQRD